MPPSIPVPSAGDLNHSVTPKKSNLSRRRRSANKRTLKRKPATATAAAATATKQEEEITRVEDSSSSNVANQLYNNSSMMPYGMSPYYGYGGMSPMMMGPLSNLNQYLFGIQNVVFSLTQAVQMLGMNQQALQQAFDSLTSMFDHAIVTFHELRALEAMKTENETEEQKNRRKRLKTIRWALLVGGTWVVSKLIRKITGRRKRLQCDGNNYANNNSAFGGSSMTYGSGSFGPQMYGSYGPASSSPYHGGSSMYGGGNYYGASGSYF